MSQLTFPKSQESPPNQKSTLASKIPMQGKAEIYDRRSRTFMSPNSLPYSSITESGPSLAKERKKRDQSFFNMGFDPIRESCVDQQRRSHVRLEPAVDLSRAMAATLERLASDGWIAEATPEYGFVFIRREDERRLLMLSSPIRTVRRGNPSLRFHRGRSIRTPSTPPALAAVGLVVIPAREMI